MLDSGKKTVVESCWKAYCCLPFSLTGFWLGTNLIHASGSRQSYAIAGDVRWHVSAQILCVRRGAAPKPKKARSTRASPSKQSNQSHTTPKTSASRPGAWLAAAWPFVAQRRTPAYGNKPSMAPSASQGYFAAWQQVVEA